MLDYPIVQISVIMVQPMMRAVGLVRRVHLLKVTALCNLFFKQGQQVVRILIFMHPVQTVVPVCYEVFEIVIL